MKKFLSALLAAALLASSLPALTLGVTAAGSTGLLFETNMDNITCTLRGLGTCKDTDIVIPSKSPAGKTVTSVTGHAFSGSKKVTSVTFPNTVQKIGNGAFLSCENLTSVTIPQTLTQIGYMAFGNCDKLTAITVASGNTAFSSAGGVLFNKSKTTLLCYPAGKQGAYTVPDTVTAIYEEAFYGCDKLTGITFPSALKEIGNQAFSDCSGLKSVTLPESVVTFGTNIFHSCTGLEEVKLPSGMTRLPYAMFSCCSALKKVTLPILLTVVGERAFFLCSSLTSFTLPDEVTEIGDDAFAQCTSLTSLTLPKGLLSIADGAFSDCTALSDVYYAGTQAEWDAVYIDDDDNEPLLRAKLHLGKESPATPPETPDPAVNLALDGTIIADSYNDELCFLTDYANDADRETLWQSNAAGNNGVEAWIGCTWASAQTVSTIVIDWGECHPSENGFYVELSDDGTSWTKVAFTAVRDKGDYDYHQIDTISLAETVETRFVRVVCFEAYVDSEQYVKENPSVYEFEVYGETGRPAGDVDGNGEVTADDLTALARHVGKIETITDSAALAAADYNGDSDVTSDDLTALARKVAKID